MIFIEYLFVIARTGSVRISTLCKHYHDYGAESWDRIQNARVWPVEKYARFVSSAPTSASSTAAKKTEGLWQVVFGC